MLFNVQGEVRLLKGHDIFVPGNEFRQLINESKVKGPTHLLQKLISLVFTVAELANSCGRAQDTGDLVKTTPLDQAKVTVLKGGSH